MSQVPDSRGPARPEGEADARLEALLGLLPPAPPPPAVETVFAKIDLPAATRRRAMGPAAWIAVAGSVVLVSAVSWLAAQPPRIVVSDVSQIGPDFLALTPREAGALRLLRGGRDVPFPAARRGDEIVAVRDGGVALEEGLEIGLDAGARLSLRDGRDLVLHEGRALFDVDRAYGAIAVETPDVVVRDVGTKFALDLSPAGAPAPRRLAVSVLSGAVEAGGVLVREGRGLAFRGAAPTGEPWPLDAKPVLSLDRGPGTAEAGKAVGLRVVLSNPTDAWIAVPSPDAATSPLFLDVTAPGGAVTAVRVTASMLEASGAPSARARLLAGGIPPRGRVEVPVRLERTFASPGTYRLRAVWQPAGTAERPTSPELVLEVR